MLQKLRYIHANPVRARLVERDEDYRWSSARFRIAVRLNGIVLAIDDAMIEEFGDRALLSLRGPEAEATGAQSETLDP